MEQDPSNKLKQEQVEKFLTFGQFCTSLSLESVHKMSLTDPTWPILILANEEQKGRINFDPASFFEN
jgi:hypothetical protein